MLCQAMIECPACLSVQCTSVHINMSLFTSIHRVRDSINFSESVKLSVYNFDITVGVALLHWGSHSRGLLRKVRRLSAKYSTIENVNG